MLKFFLVIMIVWIPGSFLLLQKGVIKIPDFSLPQIKNPFVKCPECEQCINEYRSYPVYTPVPASCDKEVKDEKNALVDAIIEHGTFEIHKNGTTYFFKRENQQEEKR